MSELEKLLKDIVYGGVGAVASVLETGSGLAKTFVEKGQKIVEQAKPAAEDWSRKIKETCDEAMKTTGVDISELSREQREQLAAIMSKLNKVEDAAAKAMRDFVSGVRDGMSEDGKTEESAEEVHDDTDAAPADEAVDADVVVEDAPEEDSEPVDIDDEESNG